MLLPTLDWSRFLKTLGAINRWSVLNPVPYIIAFCAVISTLCTYLVDKYNILGSLLPNIDFTLSNNGSDLSSLVNYILALDQLSHILNGCISFVLLLVPFLSTFTITFIVASWAFGSSRVVSNLFSKIFLQ